ncbi:MAG: hypothetical protein Fur0041_22660 [Bacteroidia bacterium]
MFQAIGQGFLFGMALCFSLGPAFFALIQVSMRYGFLAGIAMSIGVITSDVIYLMLAYFGLSGWLLEEKYALPVGLTGGLLLIAYGLFQVLRKSKIETNGEGAVIAAKTSFGGTVLKGFLLNFLNPMILLLWIGAISFASTKFNGIAHEVIIFFIATLATVFLTDTLKALAAGKIKSYLNETSIHKINVIAGIILLVSGVVVIVRLFVEQPWNK